MQPLLQPLRLDTARLAPEHRFAAWAAAFERSETFPLGPLEEFHARAEVWLLGSLIMVRSDVGPLAMQRHVRRILTDDADHYAFLVPVRGEARGDFDGRMHDFGPGTLAIMNMRRPFRIDWAGGVNFMIYVPRPELESLLVGRQDHGVLRGHGLIALVADFLLALDGALPGVAIDAAPTLGTSLRMLLAAALRELPTAGENCARLASLRGRVNAHVDAHPRGALSADVLAVALGVSRSSLYRAYNSGDGGVLGAVRRRRLAQVHRILLDPLDRRSIKEIAWNRGFADLAQLSRQFRHQFGCCPTELRAMRGDRGRTSADDSVQERFKSIIAHL